jgi:ArsR family transcriptional regulator
MTLEKRPRVSKRLERLLKSGICPAEDVSKYALELRQLVNEIIDENVVRKKRRLFRALADTTRLKILMLLEMREMCVCEIMVALDLTQPTSSHHLGILEKEGIIKRRKEGKWVFYAIADLEIIKGIEKLGSLK